MKTEAKKYELIFGSNIIQNCTHAIEFVGKGINKQIIRFVEGEDGTVLFNCRVTDEAGKTVAVIANSKVQHLAEGFRADITKEGIKVTGAGSTDPLLDFVKIGPRRFKLNGQFFLPGYRIIATDEALLINGMILDHNEFVNCSAAIGLG
jgi:hypothetical protein